MQVTIVRYEHGEGDFWQRMGPFLASAAVRRELGIPITSDEDTAWWLAIGKDGQTLGFAAARRKGDVCEMRHAYVVPEARGHGIYRQLCAERLAECSTWGCRLARSTVKTKNQGLFETLGFRAVATRGQYTVMEKELDTND